MTENSSLDRFFFILDSAASLILELSRAEFDGLSVPSPQATSRFSRSPLVNDSSSSSISLWDCSSLHRLCDQLLSSSFSSSQ